MATKIQIMSNTNYPIVDVLKSELMESESVKIAVAFLKSSGLEQIQKHLDYALAVNRATVEIIVGLDFKTTDSNALMALKNIEKRNENFKFYCFGDKKDNYNDLVFHPKIYLFAKHTVRGKEYTSIIGSSNLTGGGLTTNFEVNSILKEDRPTYYSQLSAIYNEIKYTDSIFCPSMNYISRYGDVKKELDKAEADTGNNIKDEMQRLRAEERQLPGTVPSLKKVIIDYMKSQEMANRNTVALRDIYEVIIPKTVELNMNMKDDTLKNSIRGELNKHEVGSNHDDGIKIFKRMGRGLYMLTDAGRNYSGR